MLARLRLDPLIRRNHQQHKINSSHAGQHVPHEALVPGYIDKAKPEPLAIRRLIIRGRQVHVREAEINGDAAPLLFLQPVGINSGERLHQCRLAVIDVASRAYDDGFHSRRNQYSQGL